MYVSFLFLFQSNHILSFYYYNVSSTLIICQGRQLVILNCQELMLRKQDTVEVYTFSLFMVKNAVKWP